MSGVDEGKTYLHYLLDHNAKCRTEGRESSVTLQQGLCSTQEATCSPARSLQPF